MLLSAVLLAVVVQAAPASPPKGDMLMRPFDHHQRQPSFVCLARAMALARDTGERDRPSTAPRRPRGQYAVIRTIDGCDVPAPMR